MLEEGYKRRVISLMVFFLVILGLLTARLGWLQVARGRQLAAIAANYHSRTVYYRWGHGSEGRGPILDRKLRPLTEAKLQQGLAVFASVGQRYADYEYWLQTLSEYAQICPEDIIRRSEQGKPLPLTNALPADITLPHWIVPVAGEWDSEGNFRRYSYGSLACHVLGFIQPRYRGERASGSLVGRMGIEKKYDQLLRCRRPGVSALVDARDRLIGGLGYRSTVQLSQLPNVVLTLDLEIQRLAEKIFDDSIKQGAVPATGAIVVMDPHSGHILAMVSRPVVEGTNYHHNRASHKSNNVNMLPLASLIKVVTAAAALEKDEQLLNCRFTCSGSLVLGENVFQCAHGPHGDQNMADAMANSCNLYFAQLAMKVGAKDLLAMATAMGLGSIPDIGLPASEVGAGNLPKPGDLATAAGLANNFAMGGNKIEVTPLQAAVMLSAIANGGWHVEPRLVLGVKQDLSKEVRMPKIKREKIMSTVTAKLVAKLMRNTVVQKQTCNFDHKLYVYAASALAAKTGTSDPVPPLGYHIRWCGGFFPWENPEFVVVYMAEVPPGKTRVGRGNIVAAIVEGLAALQGKD